MVPMTPEETQALLDEELIGRICFARDGEPYCIPMPFLYHEGALYFRLPAQGRKGEMMLANPRACFEVDRYAPDLSDYCSVIAEGEMVEVTDLAEKAEVRRLTGEKYLRLRAGHRPGHGKPAVPLADLALRKLVPHTLSGMKKGERGG